MAPDIQQTVLQALYFTKDARPRVKAMSPADLAKSAKLPEAQITQTLADFKAKAWAVEEPTGRWKATAEAVSGLSAPTKAKREREPKSASALESMLREVLERLSRLKAGVDETGAKVALLDAKVDKLVAGTSKVGSVRKVEPEEVRRAIREHVRQLATDQRLRGIIPVGELRRRVTASTQADAAQIDAVLVEMDRAFELDLKVSNDPSVGPSIHVPGRGEAHFVVAR